MTDLTLERPVSGLGLFRATSGTALTPSRLRRSFVLFLGVALFFGALTVALLWPWMAHLSHALIGPPEDNMNDFWNSWYASVAASPAHFFHTKLLRFPEGTPLIYQSFAYPQLFSVAMLSRWLGTNIQTLVWLQNLTLLASFPLAGIGAYCLVRHLTQSVVGGLVGGFVFAFSPFHIAQASHHAGVASIEFLPFFVLAYLLALERQSLWWLAAAALCNALSALSCWYYLFYGGYFLAFHALYARVRDGAWPGGWPLRAPLLCFGLTIVILSPFLVPMILASAPSLYFPGAKLFVADLAGFVAFPPQHILASITRGLYARFTGNPWEATVYLGLINIALLSWHWGRTGLARPSLNFYCAFGMLIFGVLAAGESLHVAGVTTFVFLPDAALDRLPFFANVRTPARAIVFVYLFMSIGVGIAVAALWQEGKAASRWVFAALAALIVLDFCPFGLQTTPVAPPSGLRVLSGDTDHNFGVLNLPFRYVAEDTYMLEQVYHRRPMVDGLTAREMSVSLLYRLSYKNLDRQREQLTRAGVKYILLHHAANGYFAWNKELAPVGAYLRAYPTVYRDSDLTILRVY